MRITTVHELKEMIDRKENILIIDTRDADEFDECHIEGSINVPRQEFDEYIPSIPRDIPVIILCKYGKKSEQMSLRLRADHQYKNTSSLLGGLWEWSREIDKSMIIW